MKPKFCFGCDDRNDCIYKETCALYIKNIPDDEDDEEWYRVVMPDLKKWTCHVPLDGKVL
jgi:hypothetical protein